MKNFTNTNTRGLSLASLRRHKAVCRTVGSLASLLTVASTSAPAFAAGTDVLGGDSVLTAATRATLEQNTDTFAQFSSSQSSAVLDWSKFNIGAGKQMDFDGSGTTFFNLVDASASKSQIDGIISGNGSVWVINPNGIAFGAASRVDVGGLFAAAAGNISNADALRSGSATLPEFSALSGGIEIGKTGAEPSKFSSERVMLLANSIKANNADMSQVDRTSFFAVQTIVLEEIEGGMINVKPQDFFYDNETGVELGDLLAGSVFQTLANGKINVTGEVAANDLVRLSTGNGDIAVKGDGSVSATSDTGMIQLSSVQLAGVDENGNSITKGDIVVEGKLSAGDGGIYMTLGYNLDTPGNTVISGDVETSGIFSIADYHGDIEISGFTKAGGMNIETGIGDVTIKSDLDADYLVRLGSYDGDITVEKGVSVTVSDADGRIEMYSAELEDGRGSILLDGDLTLKGDDGLIQLKSGRAAGSEGSIVVNGNIVAEGAYSDVSLYSGYETESKGNIEVNGQISVIGENSYVQLYSGFGDNSQGDVVVNGLIKATGGGKSGVVYLYSGYGAGASGDITINGDLRGASNGNGGEVQLTAGFGEGTQGSVAVKGNLIGEDKVAVFSGWGNSSRGDIAVSGNISVTEDDGILVCSAGAGENTVASLSINGNLEAKGRDSVVQIWTAQGNGAVGDVVINGTVRADADNAAANESYSQLSILGGIGDNAGGTVTVDGDVSANGANGVVLIGAGIGRDAQCDMQIGGKITANGENGVVSLLGGYGDGASGDVVVSTGGRLTAASEMVARTGDGNIEIAGDLAATGSEGHAAVWACGDGANSGNVRVVSGGNVSAGSELDIAADGSVSVSGAAPLSSSRGYVERAYLSPAFSAKSVYFNVGGSVGGGTYDYLPVAGKIYGSVAGSAFIAAANGRDFEGGVSSSAPSSGMVDTVNSAVSSIDKEGVVKVDSVLVNPMADAFAQLGDTSSLIAGGDLSIYTAGEVEANGLLSAGRDVTVSAGDFGDMSYLRAGGKLTINNVGHPTNPRIAYFESIDGKEPRISNLANDMVIFVDGRLAGGNLKTINQFGANEAFIVATPELKSEQGIFGNPTFIHSDLDVANPMEVSAIDYLLQEDPRLTLDTEFPREVDQHVESVVLPERDSIIFGRASNEGTPPPDKKPTDKSPGVAMN